MTDGADADVPDDTDIRPLDEQTVAQIAAGEVVERPASVVKELVENALDAEATRVEVAVENGGIDRVEVTDDGVGMTEADLRAAVREHTTSKLSDATELERVETLGFRGEALHTIGAVARLTITSKPRASADSASPGDGRAADSTATATRLQYDGGDVAAIEPAAHPEGTTVAVADLFYNTPARRKYLAEPSTEFRHVSKVVGRYALANPDVAVSLTHDGNEVFATTGDGDRRSAVLAVYGREVAESMIEVDAEPETDAVERVAGLVSDPEVTRTGRDYLATYVDDRYVEPDALRDAIVEAYGGQLAADRYPFAVLFVDVPPEHVDVNVHPRKLAVRFDEEGAVREAVTEAVRDALLDAGLVRSSAPRGVSAPDEVEVEPETLDAVGESDEGASADDAGTAPNASEAVGSEAAASDAVASEAPASEVDADGAEHTSSDGAEATAADVDRPPADADTSSTDAERQTTADAERQTTDAATSTDASTAESVASDAGATRSARESRSDVTNDAASHVADGTASDAAADSTSDASTDTTATDRRFDATEQRSLDGTSAAPDLGFDRLPSLRVLGQLRDTYVVAEDDDGLVLVDQHAADERIHYERLREAVETGTAQALAEPVELSLTPTEAETFDDYADAIERLGFHADREGQTLRVRSVPTVLDETLPPEALRDAFAALLEGGDGAGTVEAMADELLGDLACAPAIKSNTSLTEGSVADLLAALDDCENPFECPHGRPTVVRVDADEIAERFERDYPGHGDRRD